MFQAAYAHIADRIDKVYKDLTKGKAAPMGGVAYLSVEDTEVRERTLSSPKLCADSPYRNRTTAVSSITPCHR